MHTTACSNLYKVTVNKTVAEVLAQTLITHTGTCCPQS